MRYTWLDSYLLGKKGVTKDLQPSWNWIRYHVGGRMFSEIKVSKDWRYAIDENGNKHNLFGITNISFYDMDFIYDLLTDPRWSWFNSARGTEKYQAAVEWAKAAQEKQGT